MFAPRVTFVFIFQRWQHRPKPHPIVVNIFVYKREKLLSSWVKTIADPDSRNNCSEATIPIYLVQLTFMLEDGFVGDVSPWKQSEETLKLKRFEVLRSRGARCKRSLWSPREREETFSNINQSLEQWSDRTDVERLVLALWRVPNKWRAAEHVATTTLKVRWNRFSEERLCINEVSMTSWGGEKHFEKSSKNKFFEILKEQNCEIHHVVNQGRLKNHSNNVERRNSFEFE